MRGLTPPWLFRLPCWGCCRDWSWQRKDKAYSRIGPGWSPKSTFHLHQPHAWCKGFSQPHRLASPACNIFGNFHYELQNVINSTDPHYYDLQNLNHSVHIHSEKKRNPSACALFVQTTHLLFHYSLKNSNAEERTFSQCYFLCFSLKKQNKKEPKWQ